LPLTGAPEQAELQAVAERFGSVTIVKEALYKESEGDVDQADMLLNRLRSGLLIPLVVALIGCQSAEVSSVQSPAPGASSVADRKSGSASSAPEWVNRVWIRTDADNLPGVMRIFLSNGTLVMDSCWETYRLAKWKARSDTTVAWSEDTEVINADLTLLGTDELQIRLDLKKQTLTERYKEANLPYVCSEMKR
jgi:hypothetical protein